MAGSVATPDDVREWGQQLDSVARRIGARFARSETRDRVRAYLVGLLAPVQRKNSWQLAEQMGDDGPYGVQHLLGRSDWDPDEVRDDLRAYVVEALGDPDAVLILDETGFLKKGKHSAGVARQYTGTAGRIENAQVGVFLAYASRHGTAFLDRALYLPQEWADDPDRCGKAGVPEGTRFATKIRLAKLMLERAFAAGVPAAWVTGDEVYGAWELRRWLEDEGRPYVLAVRGNQYVWAGRPPGHGRGPGRRPAGAGVAHDHGRRGEQGAAAVRLGMGGDQPRPGAGVAAVAAGPQGARRPRGAGVLHRGRAGPHDARAAGRDRRRRWAIEGGFESAKQEVGLADYEVRSWTGWHRHITLALLAHAVLAAVRRLADWPAEKKSGAEPELIAVTVPEARRLAGPAAVGPPAGSRRGPGLVGVAAGPPGVRATLPLQETRGRTSGLVTTVVLERFPIESGG